MIFLQTVSVAADTTATTATTGELSINLLSLSMKGGWVMLILALLSIISIYIFIERYIVIRRNSKEDRNFMNMIREHVLSGKLSAAKELCVRQNTPISRMIEKGLIRIGKPLTDVNAAIENAGNLEVSRLEKNIAILATIASTAPMLGFLGTVIGMIVAFYDMSMAGNNIDIQLLSGGIYQAMVTTVGGLVVGIIAYVLHNVLVARIDRLVFTLEARAGEFMDLLNEPAA